MADLTPNIPEVVAEIRELFERYEKALVDKNVEVLDATFWRSPYTIRYAGDPVGYSVGLNAACNSRGCQPSTPGGRNTARGKFINYADLTMGKQFPIGEDHIEFRADVFNVFNNQNLLAGGYINLVGNPRFGQHTGGSAVFPGRQFQFAATYRF